MKKIGPLTPTITSPETMAEQCEFELLDAHGETMMNQFMIVPDNTFILFTGASGYSTYKRKELNKLFLTNKHPSIEEYYNYLYTTLFSGGSNSNTIPYPGAHIYTPGDILHDTTLTFFSELDATSFNFYGVHTLPITEPAKQFDTMFDPLVNPYLYLTRENPYMVYIIYRVNKDPSLKSVIDEAGLHPERQELWDTFKDDMTYGSIYKKLENYLETVSEECDQLSFWFQNPIVLRKKFIRPLEISHPNNKLPFSRTMTTMNLSDVVHTTTNAAIGSAKPYRLILLMACRQPDIEVEHHELEYDEFQIYNRMSPAELVKATPWQKLARRASFSAKQPADVCPVGVGAPPMNLGSVRVVMERIISIIEKFGWFDLMFIELLLRTLFGKPVGGRLSYAKSFPMSKFAEAIDMSFYPFGILEDETEPPLEEVVVFRHLIQTFQNMIRSYAVGVATNTPIRPGMTFGTHIEQLSVAPGVAVPSRSHMKDAQNTMVRSMHTLLPKGGMLRTRKRTHRKRQTKQTRRKY